MAAGVLLLFASASAFPYTNLKDGAVFDYVVVGAGAAGSAAAARLALAGQRVILIEAGGKPGLLSKIPMAAMSLQGSNVDWFHETTPNNKSCLSSHRGRCRLSGGRCLGGSTGINYMMYVRGNRADYDFDVPGWSWEGLRPYFLRYEGLRTRRRLPPSSYPYHNTSGPVDIGHFDETKNPWRRRILEGLMSLHFPYNPDVNAKSQIGVTEVLGFAYGGERVTAASAYLQHRDVQRKLKLASNIKCTEVIIDDRNVTIGVSVVSGNSNRRLKVYAKHEVILSAGTIGSAQLLMLSGIGPAHHLRSLGIRVRADLPVGESISDHVLPLIIVKTDQTLKSPLSLLSILSANAARWLVTRGGPFAAIGVSDVVGFANTDCYNFVVRKLENNGPECELPNVQIIFTYVDRYLLRVAPHVPMKLFHKEIFDQILVANDNNALLIVAPVLLQPKSKGWIRLNSADPMAAPAIAPNYLDCEGDVHEMVKSIEIVEHMVQTPSFSRYDASIMPLKLQACPEFEQSGYWECYVRHMTGSVHHAAGSVPLGPVLDGALRVRGVRRLRVGDLSVLPKIPRGNTAAVSIAIGERLADLILEHGTKED